MFPFELYTLFPPQVRYRRWLPVDPSVLSGLAMMAVVQGRLMGREIFGAEQIVGFPVPAGIQLLAGQWAHLGDFVSVGYQIPAAFLSLGDL